MTKERPEIECSSIELLGMRQKNKPHIERDFSETFKISKQDTYRCNWAELYLPGYSWLFGWKIFTPVLSHPDTLHDPLLGP